MPSLTLLGQSRRLGPARRRASTRLLALGLSLRWGLLRLVNLGHFALALLGAYLTYQLGTRVDARPVAGRARHRAGVLRARRGPARRLRVLPASTEFTSLLVTFGLTVIIESVIQWFWTADFRRYETPYATASIRVGPLFVPALELLACADGGRRWPSATWAWLRFTYVGKALRASAEDPAMAAAFGVNHRSAGLAPVGCERRLRRRRRRVHRADLHAGAVADLGLGRRRLRGGDHRRPREPDRRARWPGFLIGVSESVTMAVVTPGVGAARLVLGADPAPDRCGRAARERRAGCARPRPRSPSALALALARRARRCPPSTSRSST